LIGEGEAGRGRPIPTVAVPIVLAVFNWAPGTEPYRRLALFIDTLFPLSTASHQEVPQDSMWAEFDPSADVLGWRRFAPATMWLQGKPATAGARIPAHRMARHNYESGRPGEAQLSPAQQGTLDATHRQEQDRLYEKFLRWERSRGLDPNHLSESSR
jgi:branched-chain amino acid transport system substrate-binding protein